MWSWFNATPLQKLDHPPVVEVICGFGFAPLDIDPVVTGAYWQRRSGDFSRRELHPAIEGGLPALVVNAVPRMRVWLLSDDGSQILQIQNDRFYLNWRRTDGSSYPRFSGDQGLGERAITEFDHFSAFCRDALKHSPVIDRIELGKVDHMDEGESWNGLDDLAVMVPSMAPLLRFAERDDTAAAWRFQEELDGAELRIALNTTITRRPGQAAKRGVRIDTTVSMPLRNRAPRTCFEEANGVVNSVFAKLIPEPERLRRFVRRPEGDT